MNPLFGTVRNTLAFGFQRNFATGTLSKNTVRISELGKSIFNVNYGNDAARKNIYANFFKTCPKNIQNNLADVMLKRPIQEQNEFLSQLMKASSSFNKTFLKAHMEGKEVPFETTVEATIAASQLFRDFFSRALGENSEDDLSKIYECLLVFEKESEQIQKIKQNLDSPNISAAQRKENARALEVLKEVRNNHFKEFCDRSILAFEKRVAENPQSAIEFFESFSENYEQHERTSKFDFKGSVAWNFLNDKKIAAILTLISAVAFVANEVADVKDAKDTLHIDYLQIQNELYAKFRTGINHIVSPQPNAELQEIWDTLSYVVFGLRCDESVARIMQLDDLETIDGNFYKQCMADKAAVHDSLKHAEIEFQKLKLIVDTNEQAKQQEIVNLALIDLKDKKETYNKSYEEAAILLKSVRHKNKILNYSLILFNGLAAERDKISTATNAEIEDLRKKISRFKPFEKTSEGELNELRKIYARLNDIHINNIPITNMKQFLETFEPF